MKLQVVLRLSETQGEMNLHCFLCQKDFLSVEKLLQHRQLHQRAQQFTCGVCGREFGRASRLKEHMRSHTGERPYQCDVCMKRFSVLRVLRKHQEIHSREECSAAAADDQSQPSDQPVSSQPRLQKHAEIGDKCRM